MISKLDKYALLSNSDMHSLPKLGREANVFEIEEKDFTYGKILDTIKEKNPKSFRRTIEFYPEEGKYHFDGHKDCKFSVDPTKSTMSVCRVCGKKLLVGVVHRIKDLADRPYGFVPKNAVPYVNTVPLIEIIAYVMKGTTFSPRVESQYRKLLGVGKEFDLLMNTDLEVIEENSTKDIAKAISNVRENKITIIPGYAGIFGEIELLNRKDSSTDKIRQRSLFGD
jgi:PHP family Zn ribbon phosphoesterase